MLLTDPAEAADFVAKTKVDALAIAIGTSHGAYKFTRKPTGEVLAISRIAEIHKALPNTHLVMHGSSSVPQEWLAIINQYGGDIKETYGVPVDQLAGLGGTRKTSLSDASILGIPKEPGVHLRVEAWDPTPGRGQQPVL